MVFKLFQVAEDEDDDMTMVVMVVVAGSLGLVAAFQSVRLHRRGRDEERNLTCIHDDLMFFL